MNKKNKKKKQPEKSEQQKLAEQYFRNIPEPEEDISYIEHCRLIMDFNSSTVDWATEKINCDRLSEKLGQELYSRKHYQDCYEKENREKAELKLKVKHLETDVKEQVWGIRFLAVALIIMLVLFCVDSCEFSSSVEIKEKEQTNDSQIQTS